MTEQANAAEAARYISGWTIPMGNGPRFDCARPESTPVDLEDYCYALAFTVRFRGQTRHNGRRVFYGVGQHICLGVEHMLREGYSKAHALAYWGHESGEMPLGDMSAPLKSMFPGFRDHEKRLGNAINRHLEIETPDPILIKRFDLRMYITERRDLMGEQPRNVTPGFEPFSDPIIPYSHPERAARRMLQLHDILRSLTF